LITITETLCCDSLKSRNEAAVTMAGSPEPKVLETASEAIQRARYIRDTIAAEIAHRRQRRQQIFSWASSLLVAITGGTIALTLKQHESLSLRHEAVLAGAVVVLSAHAIFGIDRHWKTEMTAKAAIRKYDEQLGVPTFTNPPRKDWTALIAISLLAIGAFVAVLTPVR